MRRAAYTLRAAALPRGYLPVSGNPYAASTARSGRIRMSLSSKIRRGTDVGGGRINSVVGRLRWWRRETATETPHPPAPTAAPVGRIAAKFAFRAGGSNEGTSGLGSIWLDEELPSGNSPWQLVRVDPAPNAVKGAPVPIGAEAPSTIAGSTNG